MMINGYSHISYCCVL